jgi:hypothetical protein
MMARFPLVFLAVSATALAGCASAGEPYVQADQGVVEGPPVIVAPGAVPGLCCGQPAPTVTYAAPPAPAYAEAYTAPPAPYAPPVMAAPDITQEQGYVSQGAVASGGYAGQTVESSAYEETHAVEAHRFEQAYFERQRYTHHTVDRYGYLNWAGKTTDYGPGGPEGADYAAGYSAASYAAAGGCPAGAGVRVLSCQYIPFAAPVEQASLAVHDEDFAYEGGAGPIVMSGGGGGGGGGVTVIGGGQGLSHSSSSASASASATASVSTSVNISGHYGGHGGYGGGGYGGGGHMGGGGWGGGHMGGHGGCGCTHK